MKLYAHALLNVTLSESLDKYGTLKIAGGAVALLYSPTECRFAVCDDSGQLTDEQGKDVTLTEYFEARVFNDKAELRWLSDAAGKGRAALIAETDKYTDFAPEDKIESVPLYADKPLEQTYLLWGEGDTQAPVKDAATWGCLSASRIGRLYVPHTCEANQRLCLRACEYLGHAADDPHGNVVVVEERLLGLEVAR